MQRILLVEDEATVREITAIAIAQEGREIVDVPSGEAALKLLGQQDPFDLIITDNRMPGGMYGTEMVEVIRRMPERENTPIIMMSSDQGLTCEGCRVDAIVRKPLRFETIRAVVDMVIDK